MAMSNPRGAAAFGPFRGFSSGSRRWAAGLAAAAVLVAACSAAPTATSFPAPPSVVVPASAQPSRFGALSASPVPSEVSGTAASTPSATPVAPGQSQVAGIEVDPATAVSALRSAVDVGGRAAAILKILDGAHIGVYTPDGAPVVAGAERGPTDFWLYDFEVDLLATAEGDGAAFSVDQTAATLNGIGFTRDGQTITADDVSEALRQGTVAAIANPAAASSFTLRVVREIGLRSATPYDLATAVRVDQISLSALGSFLVLAQLTLPIVYAIPPQAIGASLIASTRGVRPSGVLTADACDRIAGRKLPGQEAIVEWIVDRTTPNRQTFGPDVLRALREALANLRFPMTMTFPKVIHYAPEGVTPQEFYVNVQFRGNVPPDAIACGLLHGVNLPHSIVDLDGSEVRWGLGHLEAYGRVDCPLDTCQQLKAGHANLTFYPKTERQPTGWGPIKKATAPVPVKIELRDFGAYIPFIFGTADVAIEWHQGYKITVRLESRITDTVIYNAVTTASGDAVFEDSNPDSLDGEGRLAVRTTPIAKSECHITASGSGSVEWKVRDLVVGFSDHTVSLIVHALTPREIDRYTAPNCLAGGTGILRQFPLPASLWQYEFTLSHASVLARIGNWTWKATDQTFESGGLLAEKTLMETCVPAGASLCSGTTHLSIFIEPVAVL